jgi:hypothetical protein
MKVQIKPEYYKDSMMPAKTGYVVGMYDYASLPGYIVKLDGSEELFQFGYWELEIEKEEE